LRICACVITGFVCVYKEDVRIYLFLKFSRRLF